MKYKAIIFDLDGTAIPNRRDGMPSERLIKAIEKIKDKVFICAATGRPIIMCRHILQELKLVSPCIISAGTRIIDPVTEQIFWEKFISVDKVKAVVDIARKYNYPILFGEDTGGTVFEEKVIKAPENALCIEPVTMEDTPKILAEINTIPELIAYPVISWTKDHFDIHVTHKEATKKHAVEVLLEMLGVRKDEVIGFGDSNNDLPIFEGVGYKVAMANGSEELKKAADFIAPHAEADGLAEMIEKLIKENKLNGDNS